MTLDDLFRLVEAITEKSRHREVVVIGSNSILGLSAHFSIPDDMTVSVDVDAYLKADPDQTFALAGSLGENSAFHVAHGFFLDPVTPRLPTLPEGWETRMEVVERNGLRAWFLDPDDAAVSKYARGEERDLRWIRAGVSAGVVSLAKIQSRLGQTSFIDKQEEDRARERIRHDAAWYAGIRSTFQLSDQDSLNGPQDDA